MIEKLKNKKTLFISLGSLCALLLLIVIIVVCVNANHKHTYSTTWSNNETSHWHDATCKHDVKSDEEDHTYGEWVVVSAATETTKGSKKRTCTVCKYEETSEIPLLDHTHKYSNDWSKDETGHWHNDTCGHNTKSNEEEHSYGEWTTRVEPTISTEGEKCRTCTVCGYEDTQSIEKITYTVTWLNYDDSVLKTDTKIEVGTMPSYSGVLPFRTGYDKYEYVFNGWDKEISAVTGNVTYKAQYTLATVFDYTIEGDSVKITMYNGTNPRVVIPSTIEGKNVTSIDWLAFRNKHRLTSVTIPETVTFIDNGAFARCYSLVEVINKSQLSVSLDTYENGGVANYGLVVKTEGESELVYKDDYLYLTVNDKNYLVNYIGNETSLILPNDYNGNEYEIHDFMFSDRTNVTSVAIGDGITNIGLCVFNKCTNINTIIFGSNIKSIGINCFDYSGINTVYFKGTVSEWNEIDIADGNDILKNATRYYYSESEPTDTTVNYWHYVNGVPTAW